jgi:Family of unknown function (DUF5701)
VEPPIANIGRAVGSQPPRNEDKLAFKARAEFGRQIYNLLAKGYPRVAGLKSTEFLAHVYPLLPRVTEMATSEGRDTEAIPFVVVVKGDLAPSAETMGLVERRDRAGISVLDADDLKTFRPIDGVTLPEGLAYLMVDIETGADTRNVTPDAALELIDGRQRSPLTLDEGIALLTHYPEAVARNTGFSLLGSRCGDRRVTAMWIGDGRPKLGWCWAGNPHTWLGSASCAGRFGSR